MKLNDWIFAIFAAALFAVAVWCTLASTTKAADKSETFGTNGVNIHVSQVEYASRTYVVFQSSNGGLFVIERNWTEAR